MDASFLLKRLVRISPDLCVFAMFPFPWDLRPWMSPSTSNPDPMMQPIWTPTASPVLPVPGMGGHFSGGDPQMQQFNRRSHKLRSHRCSGETLCSTNNLLLKLRPISTNFKSCTLLHDHLMHRFLHHQNLHK